MPRPPSPSLSSIGGVQSPLGWSLVAGFGGAFLVIYALMTYYWLRPDRGPSMPGREDLAAELVILKARVEARQLQLDMGSRWTAVAAELLHDLAEFEFWIGKMLEDAS